VNAYRDVSFLSNFSSVSWVAIALKGYKIVVSYNSMLEIDCCAFENEILFFLITY